MMISNFVETLPEETSFRDSFHTFVGIVSYRSIKFSNEVGAAGSKACAFQISFFPDLVQINCLFPEAFTWPIDVHFVPAFIAADAGRVRFAPKKPSATMNTRDFFMSQIILLLKCGN
jgi:hypothetical protein